MVWTFFKKNIVFFKYCIVWISSTLVDIWSLFILVDLLNINLYFSVVISFLLAVINGFSWNKFWTFEDSSKKIKTQFVKFLIISLIWLLITLWLMYLFVDILKINYLISKALTSIIVLFWNYFWNKVWTFKDEFEIILKEKKESFEIKYSIVIPAYNEWKRIKKTLEEIKTFFDEKWEKYEIIVVNDWSKDNTVEIVRKTNPEIKVIENPKNMWKWFSIKNWVLNASWEYILFTDADNSTPIENFNKLEKHLEKYDVIIWSRHLKESEIWKKQPWYRRMVGRLGNRLINILLIKWIKDTQCWFKLFKYNCANDVFPFQTINRFGFDMEILFIFKLRWYLIKEVAVSWFDTDWSRLNPVKDSLKTLWELLYIKWNQMSWLYK